MSYEYHFYRDPNFKINLHATDVERGVVGYPIHWHENPEFLYVVDGEISVRLNDTVVNAKKGEIAIINSNYLHIVSSASEKSRYYCLIPDKSFCESLSFYPEKLVMPEVMTDPELTEVFDRMTSEYNNKKPFYKLAIKGYVAVILSIVSRYCSERGENSVSDSASDRKYEMVKDAIKYMYENFSRDISVDDICDATGFSKYYFCHTFKEVTGHTAGQRLTAIRCTNARSLLSSGSCNVVESALKSGFRNPSHFTKTYKKFFGRLPSDDLPDHTENNEKE